MNSQQIKILVCCHKECVLPQDEIFVPIHCGAETSDIKLNMYSDNLVNGEECDNISAYNKNYCELTAMYWAWKNIRKIYPNIEYIGLNHYRRYFHLQNGLQQIFFKRNDEVVEYNIQLNKLESYLKNEDIIQSKKAVYPYSIFDQYAKNHYEKDLLILQEIIEEMYPEYSESYEYFINRNNKMSSYNMFIMRYSDFERYCEWIFSILDEIKNRIDLDNYIGDQARVLGYMGERLQNIWADYNMKKILLLPVDYYDDRNSKIKSHIIPIKNIINEVRWVICNHRLR